jgi:hypothetical protein
MADYITLALYVHINIKFHTVRIDMKCIVLDQVDVKVTVHSTKSPVTTYLHQQT